MMTKTPLLSSEINPVIGLLPARHPCALVVRHFSRRVEQAASKHALRNPECKLRGKKQQSDHQQQGEEER
ncbi:MAG: hypothetical protein OXH14_07570, partial [Alphaproteobacteria bacterium]|nr:hypothetical protein [Alphaproteobacteria bacterium]